jgi:hypothetical protein
MAKKSILKLPMKMKGYENQKGTKMSSCANMPGNPTDSCISDVITDKVDGSAQCNGSQHIKDYSCSLE